MGVLNVSVGSQGSEIGSGVVITTTPTIVNFGGQNPAKILFPYDSWETSNDSRFMDCARPFLWKVFAFFEIHWDNVSYVSPARISASLESDDDRITVLANTARLEEDANPIVSNFTGRRSFVTSPGIYAVIPTADGGVLPNIAASISVTSAPGGGDLSVAYCQILAESLSTR